MMVQNLSVFRLWSEIFALELKIYLIWCLEPSRPVPFLSSTAQGRQISCKCVTVWLHFLKLSSKYTLATCENRTLMGEENLGRIYFSVFADFWPNRKNTSPQKNFRKNQFPSNKNQFFYFLKISLVPTFSGYMQRS